MITVRFGTLHVKIFSQSQNILYRSMCTYKLVMKYSEINLSNHIRFTSAISLLINQLYTQCMVDHTAIMHNILQAWKLI